MVQRSLEIAYGLARSISRELNLYLSLTLKLSLIRGQDGRD